MINLATSIEGRGVVYFISKAQFDPRALAESRKSRTQRYRGDRNDRFLSIEAGSCLIFLVPIQSGKYLSRS